MADCYINEFGARICRHHNNYFYIWGRWVLLGAILVIVLAAYLLFAYAPHHQSCMAWNTSFTTLLSKKHVI